MKILTKKLPIWKKDPLRANSHKWFPKEFTTAENHVLCAKFVKFGDRKSVKSCIIYLTQKKTKFRRALPLSRLSGPARTIYSERPKFRPNPFTSGGLIAKRVNTVQTRHKVFPIFGEAVASSPKRVTLLLQCHINAQSAGE